MKGRTPDISEKALAEAVEKECVYLLPGKTKEVRIVFALMCCVALCCVVMPLRCAALKLLLANNVLVQMLNTGCDQEHDPFIGRSS